MIFVIEPTPSALTLIRFGRAAWSLCTAYRSSRWRALSCLVILLLAIPCVSMVQASSAPAIHAVDRGTIEGAGPSAGSQSTRPLYIQEYRVQGAHHLSAIAIEAAVYPFLGPERTVDDVEHARAALEKTFQDKGFQTVTVQVPPQQMRGGVVILQVTESTVGRLRVKGARYFSPGQVKSGAPSLAEGEVVDFNAVTRDIVSLNQLADRRVTPTLRAGVAPGTVDVDLDVQDHLPLHGSIELNNRYSSDTTSLRLNGFVSYNNLWQLGHSAGLSFQTAPERPDDAKVFSAFYTARLASVPSLSLTIQGTKQDSNVSTLGGTAVAGRGEVVGARLTITLPAEKAFFHSLSLGFDYKHFDQNILLGGAEIVTPITYYPFTAGYTASWIGKESTTDFNADVVFHLRGMGSGRNSFDAKRFNADGNFIYLRGDLSHTRSLPGGAQIYGKIQGQISDSALLDSEEFAGGGLGTARGYLESVALGDNGLFGTLELRSPSILDWWSKKYECRIYLFGDAGVVTLNDPLPEQTSQYTLASYGAGGRIRIFDHLNGSLDVGVPLISQSITKSHDLLLTFRVWADF